MTNIKFFVFAMFFSSPLWAQTSAVSSSVSSIINADRINPVYPIAYAPVESRKVTDSLERVLNYLTTASPVKIVNADTKQSITDYKKLSGRVMFDYGAFNLTTYEWGVTYSGMLLAAQTTGNPKYLEYVSTRLKAIAAMAAHIRKTPYDVSIGGETRSPLRSVLKPKSLDDSGSMAAAFIKASLAGVDPKSLRPWIDNYMNWVYSGQMRFADGTLARNRPMPNSLWLDDLYMSVPALAQMGVLTGEQKYFNDAVKQILQFSSRMFLQEKGLYRHGWVEGMEPHPSFQWARANGWAILAMAELLSVLPSDHSGYNAVLKQYRAHVAGLAAVQDRTGLWHQLLDRQDSYLETSASAMYVYAIARGINRGWLDPLAYGPMVSIAWNAVSQQINAIGQVENTCIGTGMGFDPAYYYYRPVSEFAAHGYGPVLLAGAEMLKIVTAGGAGSKANVHDGALLFSPAPPESAM